MVHFKSTSREFVFKFLYQFNLPELKELKRKMNETSLMSEINKFEVSYLENDNEHPDNELESNSKEFAYKVLSKYFEDSNSIESIVESHSNGWKIENIDKVDLAIIIMAATELRFFETPKAVVINESVNLAKKFGSEKSASFINGLLDSI